MSKPEQTIILCKALHAHIAASDESTTTLSEMIVAANNGDVGPSPTDDEGLNHLRGALYGMPTESRFPLQSGQNVHLVRFANGRAIAGALLPNEVCPDQPTPPHA